MIDPKIRPLFDEERDHAYENARNKIAGPEIDPQAFRASTPSRYPVWTVSVVVIFCFIVLGAAFLPSAYRLFLAGSETFCEAVNDGQGGFESSDYRCGQVGVATVILAEAGMLVFFFALAVLGAPRLEEVVNPSTGEKEWVDSNRLSRRIFWGGAVLSMMIALIGNAHTAEPWAHGGYVFAYFETFSPPIIVMAVGYVLKELFLIATSRRHQFTVELKQAQEARLRLLQDPEKSPDWLRALSQALKNELRRAHSRYKRELELLTSDEWRYLIKREMLSYVYTVDPTTLTGVEKQAMAEEQSSLLLETPSTPTSNPEGGEVLDFSEVPVYLEIFEDELTKFWVVRYRPTGEIVGREYRRFNNAIRSGERFHLKKTLGTAAD